MTPDRLRPLGIVLWRWLRSPLSPLPVCLVLVGMGFCSRQADEHSLRSAGGREEEHQYDGLLQAAARRHMPSGWDWRLLKAMVRQESNFQPEAESAVGARGLCQMMPKTAASMGVPLDDLSKPTISINSGTRYLRKLWDRWINLSDGPPRWTRSRFAIASYNAGITRVRRIARRNHARNWTALCPLLPEETQIHVAKVFDLYYPRYARNRPWRRRIARPSFSPNRR